MLLQKFIKTYCRSDELVDIRLKCDEETVSEYYGKANEIPEKLLSETMVQQVCVRKKEIIPWNGYGFVEFSLEILVQPINNNSETDDEPTESEKLDSNGNDATNAEKTNFEKPQGDLGDDNLGDGNRGNYNRGDGNQGDRNRGDYNQGCGNRGDNNRGDNNRGDNNQGRGNCGNENRGIYNKGHNNQGNCNQGYGNRGDDNQGEYNRGDGNQGCGNRGNNNIGIGNKGDYIVGLWCTQKQPFYLFNKLCSIPLDEFEQSENYELLMHLTQAENPQLEWESFTPEEKQITLSTENITPEIFKELFDIDVTGCEDR